MDGRKNAVGVIQAAWRDYAPFGRLAAFHHLLHTPPMLVSKEHDRTVQHLTTFLTTGPVQRKEDFLNRAHALCLYPFTSDKLEDDQHNSRKEPPEALWSELLHADNGRPLLKAGSVPFLIQSLVSDYGGTEQTFLEDFLLTYRTFLTPRALLLLLILRYWVPLGDTAEKIEERKKERIPIQIKTVLVLRMWIELVPTDFTDDEVLTENATCFLTGIETFKVASGEILKLLKEKSSMTGRDPDSLLTLRPRSESDGPERGPGGAAEDSTNEDGGGDSDGGGLGESPKIRSSGKLGQQDRSFLSFDAADVAYEWTLLAQRVYRAITPREFVKQAWNNKAKLELAPNVSALIDDFNQMSEWVSLVVLSFRDKKRRGEAISRFVQIAYECHRLKNYHTVMVILSGLTKAHVTRLKKSWEIVDNRMKSKLKLLNELMGMDANYHQYRQLLRETTPPTPSVPFLGLFLTDLTFLDEGNSELVSSAERSASSSSSSTSTSSSTPPSSPADSGTARTTASKRRSFFYKVKSDRSVKLEQPKLREASTSPPASHKESDGCGPAATDRSVPPPPPDSGTESPHTVLSSSHKRFQHRKGQLEDSDKRLSLKAVRSLSVYMKETSEKMRGLRVRKSSAFATFDDSDLLNSWRDKESPKPTPEEEEAIRSWKQLEETTTKQAASTEMQDCGGVPSRRGGRRAQAKRMPQVFDSKELSALLEKQSDETDVVEDVQDRPAAKEKNAHGNDVDVDDVSLGDDVINVKGKEKAVDEASVVVVVDSKVALEEAMLVNWMKKRTMAKVLREFLRFQGCNYPLPKKLEKKRRKLRKSGGGDHTDLLSNPNTNTSTDPHDISAAATTGGGALDDVLSEQELATREEIRYMLREMRLPPDIANVLDFSTYTAPTAPQSPLQPQHRPCQTPSESRTGSSSAGASPRSRSDTAIVVSPRSAAPSIQQQLTAAVAENQFKSPRSSAIATSRTPPSLSPRGPPVVSIKRTTSMPSITFTEEASSSSDGRVALDLTATTAAMTPTVGPEHYWELFTMKKLKLDDSLLFDLSLHLEPRSGSLVGNGPEKKALFVITPQTSPASTPPPYRSRNKITRTTKEDSSDVAATPQNEHVKGEGTEEKSEKRSKNESEGQRSESVAGKARAAIATSDEGKQRAHALLGSLRLPVAATDGGGKSPKGIEPNEGKKERSKDDGGHKASSDDGGKIRKLLKNKKSSS